MKKLMMTLGFAALCGAVLPVHAEIESGTVGYNTATLQEGWNMFAVNFQKIGETPSISIQDLFPGTTAGLTAHMNGANADQIQVYNPTTGGYTTYYLYYTELAVPALQAKNYKWVTAAGAVSDATFTNGSVFWYRKRGADDVTINVTGQVSLEPQTQIQIVNGWNMIANAFPVNFNPNALGSNYWKESGAVAHMSGASADQLQIYNPSTGGYTTYYLYYTDLAVPALQAKNWQWVSASGAVVDSTAEVMSVGKGAWYRHRGNGFTLTIPSPIAE